MDEEIKFGGRLPIPAVGPPSLIKVAQLLERNNFDSVWAADHLLMLSQGTVPDAWSILSAVAQATENIELGTCVSDPHRKNPAVFAQILATVDRLSNGRVNFGIGPGETMNLKPLNIDCEKPVSKTVETIEIIRRLLSGERFSFNGEFWSLKNVFLQIEPEKDKIPVYLGANGPKTRQITGEVAEGWMPTGENVDLYNKHMKDVERGAEKEERDLGNIDTALNVYTAVAEDQDDAKEALRPYRANIAPIEKIKEAGHDIDAPEVSYYSIEASKEAEEKFQDIGKHIPLEIAAEFSIVGTPEDCIEKIERYIKAGVKHFNLVNVGPDVQKTVELYGDKIIPYFKE